MSNRNAGFDFLKFICAFLVICIHTDYAGKECIVLVARAAVPIFFMITGYFYSSIAEKGRQGIQMRKIFCITVLANLLYFVWELLIEFATSHSVQGKLALWQDPETWIHFLVLNESPFRSHLWYLSALLYVLAIVYVLEKYGIREKVYGAIPILFVFNLALGNYSTLLTGNSVPLEYSRNFLFAGLPCFLLGDWLYQRKDKKQFGNGFFLALLVFSLAATIGEYRLITRYCASSNQDLFIGTIGGAYAVFSLVKNNPKFFEKSWTKCIAWGGKNLSLGLYVLNTIVRTVVQKMVDACSDMSPLIGEIWFAAAPVIMLVATSCVVYGMKIAADRVKRTKQWY